MFPNNNSELLNLDFSPKPPMTQIKRGNSSLRRLTANALLAERLVAVNSSWHLIFFNIQIACGLTRVTKSLDLFTARLYSFRGLSINGIEEGRAVALTIACLRSEYRQKNFN